MMAALLVPYFFVFHAQCISILQLTEELKKLRKLVINAKEHDIRVVSALVKRMLEKNVFLFGSVDTNEGSFTETVDQLTQLQNARVQVAYKEYVQTYVFSLTVALT